ncbi:MAG: type IV toxin-antitoxin system AbiEi family antitoxin domain-containing protein [Lachnospiraceae bacterium]|nr:type IV toxin-antitoxin system AbiEi family antitoxin domain-containing protein [Candidatus Equihabitans merdae]
MYESDREWIINNADNGLITSRTITEHGMHRSILSEMVKQGELIRCSRGIYMLVDEWEDEFYLLQQRYKRGIFSHATALYLLGYSERVPLSFHMTFPTKYNSQSLKQENVVVTRVNDNNYELGVSSVATPSGNQVQIYDLERSLCDVVRGSGDDIQIIQFAMKKYISSKERDINKLMRYAKQLRVEPKVRKYVEVLL